MASWFGFAAVSGAFGGLIAFGIQTIPLSHIAIANWRLLFLVEGIPTILLGLLCMWLLPDRPEKDAKFLSEGERRIQKERMSRGLMADEGRVVNKSEGERLFLNIITHSISRAHHRRLQGLESENLLSSFNKTFRFHFTDGSLIDIPSRGSLLRNKLCPRLHICLSPYNYQDIWI